MLASLIDLAFAAGVSIEIGLEDHNIYASFIDIIFFIEVHSKL